MHLAIQSMASSSSSSRKQNPLRTLIFIGLVLCVNHLSSVAAQDSPPAPTPDPSPDSPSPAPFRSPPAPPVPTPSPSADNNSPPAPPPSDLPPPPAPASAPAPGEDYKKSPPPVATGNVNQEKSSNVNSKESDNGLSGGQKAGIAFGVIFGVGIVVIGALIYRKRQQNQLRSQYGFAARREFL